MATLVDMEPNDIDKISKIFDDAIRVDSALIENLEHQIWMAEKSSNKEKKTWDETITSMFTPHIETLFRMSYRRYLNCVKENIFRSLMRNMMVI